MPITLDDLRRFTVARNFPNPATLKRVLHQIGFVQADPIRAPARAQDLILRHRVKNYHAGDLERRYAELDIEEDFFVNYGYVTRSLWAMMHPRTNSRAPRARGKRAQLLLDFVRERGAVHPREVDEHFSHGKVTNNWGGSSNATTHLLDALQYRGLLRVARREKGIRIYAASWHPQHRSESTGETPVPHSALDSTGPTPGPRSERIDALIDTVVNIYAPLPGPSLSPFLRRLRFAVPQWRTELTRALQRAKQRLSCARVDGTDWYWPAEVLGSDFQVSSESPDKVRLLAPFDPLVHDRTRFELLWNWVYRFEAYTPAPKRKLGYYAMPLLWRDQVIGWANVSVKNRALSVECGYAAALAPRDRAFKRELEAELERMQAFLGLDA